MFLKFLNIDVLTSIILFRTPVLTKLTCSPWERFTREAWSLEPPAVDALMDKIENVGIPLEEFAGVKPYWGVCTGLNAVFLIDEDRKNELVNTDPISYER
jgi:hypothetical protein